MSASLNRTKVAPVQKSKNQSNEADKVANTSTLEKGHKKTENKNKVLQEEGTTQKQTDKNINEQNNISSGIMTESDIKEIDKGKSIRKQKNATQSIVSNSTTSLGSSKHDHTKSNIEGGKNSSTVSTDQVQDLTSTKQKSTTTTAATTKPMNKEGFVEIDDESEDVQAPKNVLSDKKRLFSEEKSMTVEESLSEEEGDKNEEPTRVKRQRTEAQTIKQNASVETVRVVDEEEEKRSEEMEQENREETKKTEEEKDKADKNEEEEGEEEEEERKEEEELEEKEDEIEKAEEQEEEEKKQQEKTKQKKMKQDQKRESDSTQNIQKGKIDERKSVKVEKCLIAIDYASSKVCIYCDGNMKPFAGGNEDKYTICNKIVIKNNAKQYNSISSCWYGEKIQYGFAKDSRSLGELIRKQDLILSFKDELIYDEEPRFLCKLGEISKSEFLYSHFCDIVSNFSNSLKKKIEQCDIMHILFTHPIITSSEKSEQFISMVTKELMRAINSIFKKEVEISFNLEPVGVLYDCRNDLMDKNYDKILLLDFGESTSNILLIQKQHNNKNIDNYIVIDAITSANINGLMLNSLLEDKNLNFMQIENRKVEYLQYINSFFEDQVDLIRSDSYKNGVDKLEVGRQIFIRKYLENEFVEVVEQDFESDKDKRERLRQFFIKLVEKYFELLISIVHMLLCINCRDDDGLVLLLNGGTAYGIRGLISFVLCLYTDREIVTYTSQDDPIISIARGTFKYFESCNYNTIQMEQIMKSCVRKHKFISEMDVIKQVDSTWNIYVIYEKSSKKKSSYSYEKLGTMRIGSKDGRRELKIEHDNSVSYFYLSPIPTKTTDLQYNNLIFVMAKDDVSSTETLKHAYHLFNIQVAFMSRYWRKNIEVVGGRWQFTCVNQSNNNELNQLNLEFTLNFRDANSKKSRPHQFKTSCNSYSLLFEQCIHKLDSTMTASNLFNSIFKVRDNLYELDKYASKTINSIIEEGNTSPADIFLPSELTNVELQYLKTSSTKP